MLIRDDNGTFIGELLSKEFQKKVSKKKHLFKVFDAWGIDAKFFREVLLPNNILIRVLELDDKVLYEIRAEKFSKYSKHFHFKNDKVDNLAQIFCPITRFKQTNYGKK